MTNKYHINPATGKAALCRAKIKCRFGDTPHYGSKAEAENAFSEQLESAHKEKLLEGLKRELPSDVAQETEDLMGELAKAEEEFLQEFPKKGADQEKVSLSSLKSEAAVATVGASAGGLLSLHMVSGIGRYGVPLPGGPMDASTAVIVGGTIAAVTAAPLVKETFSTLKHLHKTRKANRARERMDELRMETRKLSKNTSLAVAVENFTQLSTENLRPWHINPDSQRPVRCYNPRTCEVQPLEEHYRTQKEAYSA